MCLCSELVPSPLLLPEFAKGLFKPLHVERCCTAKAKRALGMVEL